MAGLEIDEHIGEQRTFWVIQRVAWALLGLVILAATLGLLGSSGPLHSRTTGAGSALEVRHPRVQRLASDMTIELRVSVTDSVSVVLPASFFRDHRLDAWTPEPASAHVMGEEMHFDFGSADRIVLHATALSPGRKSLTIRTAAGASRDVDYLVLP